MITMLAILKLNIISMAIAIVLDLIFGDPYGFPHPVIYIGKLISKLEKFFRSRSKSEQSLKSAGLYIFILVVLVTYLITFAVVEIFSFSKITFILMNSFILYTTLAAKCLKDEAIKVYNALENDGVEQARIQVSYIVGRDTSQLNENEIVRATVETVAENTSDGIIAPMIFGLIGGAPLAMAYKAVNTMDSMIGYMTKKYFYIGYFPAKLDDIFNYIPARLTGFFMSLSAPIVKGNIITALNIMVRDRKNHKSPNCAYPEGAAAGAMNVQLGGTNIYFGEVIEKPTIGDRNKELEKNHIKECNRLMITSEILFFIVYILIIGAIIIWQRH